MDRAIVTFHDPKTDQKIIINFSYNKNQDYLDFPQVKFDPTPNEDDELGLIAYLSEIFLTALNNGQDSSVESDSR